MFKAQIIVADPPYLFSDNLGMSSTLRSAASNYNTLDMQAIKDLDVSSISADDAILALWIPSALLQDGLNILKSWNFEYKQNIIWVKTKISPLEDIKKFIINNKKKVIDLITSSEQSKLTNKLMVDVSDMLNCISSFSLNNILSMYMGRIFRQTHEIALIGVRGNVYSELQNKSQRSVMLDINKKHSEKTEILQDRLQLMFPNFVNRLELFARRDRPGWTCMGLECPSTVGHDIRQDIDFLKLV